MDIMYTVNHNYVEIVAASILSVIMNNSNMHLHFHIITLDFKEEDYSFLEKLSKDNENIEINFYRLEDYNIEQFEIPSWRGNQIANARLFFQDIVETAKIKQLLYLDADTIVTDNLSTILKYSGAVNAVLETVFKYRLENLGLKKYFNSGVLLFDVEKWIERDIQRTIIDYITKHPNLNLFYPDQDLMNLAIGFEINELPFRYNVSPYALIDKYNFNKRYYGDDRKYTPDFDLEEEVKNAIIYHSYGFWDIKPWSQNQVNPLTKSFDKYLEMINPDFNKEKLKGIKNILVNHPNLFYFALDLNKNVVPAKALELIEGYSATKKRK